jgi:peptidoglycan/xylan/chitin deacetylase (PgdA/CDA1 family)
VLVSSSIWPDGIKCGVAFTFDVDAETFWFSRRMDSLNSVNLMAEGSYDPEVGVPRILAMLDRQKVKSTFFIPGWVVEHHTAICREIVKRGHEVAYHGYLHEKAWFPEQERELIAKSRKIMKELLGVEPRGHRAPEADLGPETIDLLVQCGFEYSSNMMDRDCPYLHHTSKGEALPELPFNWLYDDTSHFFFTLQEPSRRPIAPASTVREIWIEEFEGIYEEGGSICYILHPMVCGRVSRVKMLEDIITHIKKRPGVLLGTAEEICRAAKAGLLKRHNSRR